MRTHLCITASLIVAFAAFAGNQRLEAQPAHSGPAGFVSNDEFIRALYDTTVDVTNCASVFDYFYAKLPPVITVYPSENYYYYVFPLHGRIFKGSLGLYPDLRDSGKIDFGYMEKYDDARISDYQAVGQWMHVGKGQGLEMTKLDPLHYRLNYKGKSVSMNFHQPGLDAPPGLKLTADEEFVANTLDESGLGFCLVFNKSQKHLYWVLNENGFVPEQFIDYSDGFRIGKRTRFAFYSDSACNRKILVGVWLQNVLLNNWYDGPFDQMPDNNVWLGKVEVQKYLEQTYPIQRGFIDKFGHYVYEPGSRLPVATYMVYNTFSDLYYRLENARKYCRNHSEFCASITRQEFTIPDNFYISIVNDNLSER